MSETPLFKNVENDGLDCRLFGYICDLEERGGFYDASEIYLAKLAQGYAQTELPVTEMHLDWQGMVQEGAYVAEAAAAANFALHTLDKIGMITKLDLDIKRRAGKSTVLLCEARLVNKQDDRYVVAINILDQKDNLLAEGTAYLKEESDFIATYADYLRSIGYDND